MKRKTNIIIGIVIAVITLALIVIIIVAADFLSHMVGKK